jgi:hypothetical protein
MQWLVLSMCRSCIMAQPRCTIELYRPFIGAQTTHTETTASEEEENRDFTMLAAAGIRGTGPKFQGKRLHASLFVA